jgi:hypothetical protein
MRALLVLKGYRIYENSLARHGSFDPELLAACLGCVSRGTMFRDAAIVLGPTLLTAMGMTADASFRCGEHRTADA